MHAALERSRAGWLGDTRTGHIAVFVLVACGLAVVAASVALDEFGTSSPTTWLLAAPLLLLVAYLASLGPKWAVAFLMGAIVFGFSGKVTLGSFDLRVPDLFYVILFGWALVIRARAGQRGYLIGRPLLALWFVALGLSLYPLLLQGDIGVDELIPWLRLLATFSLVWLVPYALRTRRDVHFALGALGAVATVEVGKAVVDALLHGQVSTRLEGTWGAEHDRPHLRVGGDPRDPRAGAAAAFAAGRHARGRRRRPAHRPRSLGATAALVVALGSTA